MCLHPCYGKSGPFAKVKGIDNALTGAGGQIQVRYSLGDRVLKPGQNFHVYVCYHLHLLS